MFVVFRLSALLTVSRSSSVYRSFSALAALIRFSHSYAHLSSCSDVYGSFAADGCIFHLETLARSLVGSCTEKGYLLALVDIGRAALITVTNPIQRYNVTAMTAELLDAIHLQQYVPSPPTQSYLIVSPERTTAFRLLPLVKLPLSSQKHAFPSACTFTLLPVAPLKRHILPLFSSYTL